MDKDSRLGIAYFLILFFTVISPKIITYLTYVMGVDTPYPITFLLLFPLIAFLPPILAVFFSMRIEKPKISFIFCFSSIIAGAFVHEVLTYGAGLLRIPSLQSLMLWISGAIGLGFIGSGVSMRGVKTELRLSFFLMGIIFWTAMVIEGVYRWLGLIIGLIR